MSRSRNDLTQERLRSAVDYDPKTGIFIWKFRDDCSNRFNSKWSGKRAGYLNPHGRVMISINKTLFSAHRLAWLYVYGAWPNDQIDHVNGDPSDNRIDNLRDVSHAENMQNYRRPKRNNVSGHLGVVFDKRWGRFSARIATNGKRISLGSFDTAEEAGAAYLDAKRKLHSTCSI